MSGGGSILLKFAVITIVLFDAAHFAHEPQNKYPYVMSAHQYNGYQLKIKNHL